MASDDDVVVAGILQKEPAAGVGLEGSVPGGFFQSVEVGPGIEVAVEVDDQFLVRCREVADWV